MKKLILVMMAVLMALSLAGCGKEEKKPAVEKILRVALGDEPNIPDPPIATDNVSYAVLNQMYLGLFELDKIGNPQNAACESYTLSDDGLVYTFKIKDMKWSDGQAVTADDFVYGMKRSLGLGVAESYYCYYIGNYLVGPKKEFEIDGEVRFLSAYNGGNVADMVDLGVKALDAKTLEITLEKPVPFFTSLMASAVFYPARKDFAKEHDSTWAYSVDVPVNGPFKPEKLALNEEIVLVKNPNFIYADKVSLDKVILIPMADEDAQVIAFETGEIDMATRPSMSAIAAYKGRPELVWPGSTINYYMQMNGASFTTAKALQNKNIRRAIQLAIDREQLTDVLAVVGNHSPLYGYVPVGIPGAKGDFRTEQDEVKKLVYYDPEEAVRLLTEAGYTVNKPLKLEYYYNSSARHDTVATNLQAQLKKVGVEIHFKTADFPTVLRDRDQLGKYELARGAFSADFIDPTTFLDMWASWSQQKAVINDPIYDGFLKEAEVELDPVKRMEILHKAENYLVDEMAYINPLFYYDNAYFIRVGITGIGMDPAGGTRFAYVKLP